MTRLHRIRTAIQRRKRMGRVRTVFTMRKGRVMR